MFQQHARIHQTVAILVLRHSQTVFPGSQVREGQLAVLIDYEGAQNLVPLFGEQVNDVLFANALQIDK